MNGTPPPSRYSPPLSPPPAHHAPAEADSTFARNEKLEYVLEFAHDAQEIGHDWVEQKAQQQELLHKLDEAAERARQAPDKGRSRSRDGSPTRRR